MDSLVLLILGAVWAAVLIPPLLRSRFENRPNSSVTDFRRQLNKLQNTVPSRAGGSRAMARPLAQTPLARPAAGGRPGQPVQRRSQGRQHGGRQRGGDTMIAPTEPRVTREPRAAGPRRHGDATGAQRRPDEARRRGDETRRQTRPDQRTQVARHSTPENELVRRRRSNVLIALLIVAGGSLFLAADTKEPIMLYLFALSFVALCGYVFLLSQARQREANSWGNDWMS